MFDEFDQNEQIEQTLKKDINETDKKNFGSNRP